MPALGWFGGQRKATGAQMINCAPILVSKQLNGI